MHMKQVRACGCVPACRGVSVPVCVCPHALGVCASVCACVKVCTHLRLYEMRMCEALDEGTA